MKYTLWIRDFRDDAIIRGPFKCAPDEIEANSLMLLDNIHPDHYLDVRPLRNRETEPVQKLPRDIPGTAAFRQRFVVSR